MLSITFPDGAVEGFLQLMSPSPPGWYNAKYAEIEGEACIVIPPQASGKYYSKMK